MTTDSVGRPCSRPVVSFLLSGGVMRCHSSLNLRTIAAVTSEILCRQTEGKETLDAFCDAMLAIAREAAEEPELLKEAPHHRPVKRLDEVRAAKTPVVKYGFGEHSQPEAEPAPASTQAPSGV